MSSRRSLRHVSRAATVALVLALLPFAAGVVAQTETDIAISFFSAGGAYCFRLAPEGTSLSDETTWTVMMLTGTVNNKMSCRIRSVEPGATRIRGDALTNVGLAVTTVWRRERSREEFFERFAAGLSDGKLRARIVTLAPPGLEGMTTMQRADLYLRFADRGTRVEFDKAPDLTAPQLLEYQTFLPD